MPPVAKKRQPVATAAAAPPPGPGTTSLDMRRQFLTFDDLLASKGVFPLTSWWRNGIGEWLDRYEKGGVLELWACVGRGAAKSTAMYKLALFFALVGNFNVPPGEIHYAMILSRRKDEAAKGVGVMARWLELLGVSARRKTIRERVDKPGGELRITGHLIEFPELRRGIRVAAANVQATSGWRAFFVAKDERSKWKMSGIDEEDAEEIDTSAVSMTATHAGAPSITVGSAWGTEGAFFEMFQKRKVVNGETVQPRYAHILGPAATWVAAPHISEASLRAKERDRRRFNREFKCEFQAGLNPAFDPDLVEASFEAPQCAYRVTPRRPHGENSFFCGLYVDHDGPCKPLAEMLGHISHFTRCEQVALIDPTAGGSDTFAWAIVGWRHMPARFPKDHPSAGEIDPDGEFTYKLVFDYVDGIQEATKKGVTSEDVVRKIALDAQFHNVKKIFSDQYSQFGLDALFRQEGFSFSAHTWSNKSKEMAMERVRAWLSDHILVFGDADGEFYGKLKHEMLAFEEKISKSGALTFQGRRGGHDDFAMLVLLAAIVDIEKGLPGSPLFLKNSQVAEETSHVEHRTIENSLGVMSDALLDGLAMPME